MKWLPNNSMSWSKRSWTLVFWICLALVKSMNCVTWLPMFRNWRSIRRMKMGSTSLYGFASPWFGESLVLFLVWLPFCMTQPNRTRKSGSVVYSYPTLVMNSELHWPVSNPTWKPWMTERFLIQLHRNLLKYLWQRPTGWCGWWRIYWVFHGLIMKPVNWMLNWPTLQPLLPSFWTALIRWRIRLERRNMILFVNIPFLLSGLKLIQIRWRRS